MSNVRLNVGLCRGSRKQGFKNAPKPYHAIEDVSRISFFCLLSITQGRSPTSLKICIQCKILQGKLEKQHSEQ